ncbi:MAG: hypothetical protein Q7J15_04125 [Candidatus Desulfaltia sp.]|nr:hypothetical protein [Candidatus Desulfaltia sp.]
MFYDIFYLCVLKHTERINHDSKQMECAHEVSESEACGFPAAFDARTND